MPGACACYGNNLCSHLDAKETMCSEFIQLAQFFAVWTGVLTLSFIALLVKYFSLSVEAQMLMGMCISVGTFISLLYIHCWQMRK